MQLEVANQPSTFGVGNAEGCTEVAVGHDMEEAVVGQAGVAQACSGRKSGICVCMRVWEQTLALLVGWGTGGWPIGCQLGHFGLVVESCVVHAGIMHDV